MSIPLRVRRQSAAAPPELFGDEIQHVLSHASEHHYPTSKPNILAKITTATEDVDVYNRFSKRRKTILTTAVAFCSLCSPFSTTCIFSAVPEIAAQFGTTGTVINITSTAYLLCMAIAPLWWGPMSQVYGRKPIYTAAALGYTVGSMGTALSKNLATFVVFRCVCALFGSALMACGAGIIADMYEPRSRGTAMGYYLSGTVIGPALGPFIAGLIINWRPWPDVFWFTVGLGGVALLLCLFVLPETSHHRIHDDLRKEQGHFVVVWVNPLKPLCLFIYPNIALVGLVSSFVLWMMYSLLTPIRYVINPRFGITSPALSGLFNLAPGFGYLVGTFVGGRFADYEVRKWVRIRGRRVPEDRLRSAIWVLLLVLPGTALIYGWSIDQRKGGIAVPVIAMFFNGIAQLVLFTCVNTYCVDCMQERSTEVVGANYSIRYVFAATASAVILPLIDAVGVGWANTLAAALLVLSGVFTILVVKFGERWRLGVDEWIKSRSTTTNPLDVVKDSA
ncbi:major facilitator superfamily domain-containing protein [Protomyces lactucae-debilis]|uniref:Major facilitator superfamily domain-containing protein n=1 Tax=Protomyces lactucae-debilis TaxID=2754530 RepID=A0A1Y2FIH7_PROLT|nr:major facilitator superfamily domain-containing protein [Protomyces lactucae-debilis]ORY83733.1 major facilitator superfamily domain-containing protein [Protomyces lactucae-debilis]